MASRRNPQIQKNCNNCYLRHWRPTRPRHCRVSPKDAHLQMNIANIQVGAFFKGILEKSLSALKRVHARGPERQQYHAGNECDRGAVTCAVRTHWLHREVLSFVPFSNSTPCSLILINLGRLTYIVFCERCERSAKSVSLTYITVAVAGFVLPLCFTLV